jgi:hypothetical protein
MNMPPLTPTLPTSSFRIGEGKDQELHEQLCQLRLKYNRLERDRNDQAHKTNKLEQLLNGYEGDNPQEALLTKSLQLAEAQTIIESLQAQFQALTAENNNRAQQQEQREQQNLQKQSSFRGLMKQGSLRGLMVKDEGSFRGLMSQNSFRRRSSSRREEDESQRIANLHQKIMEKQIEAFEEERDCYAQKCVSRNKVSLPVCENKTVSKRSKLKC